MTAEIGRQPWLVYGLMRTSAGYSTHIGAGNAACSRLLGFMGMYTCSPFCGSVLVYRIIEKGPETAGTLSKVPA